MPVDHYENFPVASLLIPRAFRPAVEALYAFARSADDIADEGGAQDAERLAGLAHYQAQLDAIERGEAPEGELFLRLAAVVKRHALPVPLLRDLLDAFAQDVVKKRYADFAELTDYCRRSANPVGRLMLRIFGCASAENDARSDAICTSLQLINFWQDVAVDLGKGRIYLPEDDRRRFGVTEEALIEARRDEAWRKLMRFQIERTRALMLEGAPLVRALPGRFGWEIRLVVQGGLRILEAIEAADFDVFDLRPQLRRSDWFRLALRAARMSA
jgi:squalene synthase HpnC